LDAMNFVSMLLFVIVAGMIFGNALGSSGISNALIQAIKDWGISQLGFLGIIIVIYVIWGIICDAPIIVILTVPVLAPIAKEMGIDLIWFGVLTTATVNMGSITPPYAMGIFMMRSILPDIPLTTMYKGIIPYVIASLILILIILFIPEVVMWLPNLMK
jgi:C4-dicarboxylate transporter, DctM subunit